VSRRVRPVPPAPGQESVWDYPRPPRLERTGRHVAVRFGGVVVAESQRAWRVLETSHPPVYYLPREDVIDGVLEPAAGGSWCEFKGMASYWSVVVPATAGGQQRAERAAWSYEDPSDAFRPLRGAIAFYPALMDSCTVDGEPARPQAGGFYGGWVTDDIVGPFKGEPGTLDW
jgi:uncharacterized protein (DUF427 family)